LGDGGGLPIPLWVSSVVISIGPMWLLAAIYRRVGIVY
jgi:hypothetical protein